MCGVELEFDFQEERIFYLFLQLWQYWLSTSCTKGRNLKLINHLNFGFRYNMYDVQNVSFTPPVGLDFDLRCVERAFLGAKYRPTWVGTTQTIFQCMLVARRLERKCHLHTQPMPILWHILTCGMRLLPTITMISSLVLSLGRATGDWSFSPFPWN